MSNRSGPSSATETGVRWLQHPLVHGLALAGLAAFYLGISWRKWPDPVTDFGRELYVPWRLAEGALLYRDADDFYGPLSQYMNAGLFRALGPGLMVLVGANLVVFAAIVGVLYFLVRRGWGATAAVAAPAVFIAVFGFSRFLYSGNCTYAAPYSHETTHGMLLTLALVATLVRWLRHPGVGPSALAGFLFGLLWVLKPEFILAGGAAVGVAFVLHLRAGTRWRPAAWIAALAFAVLPSLGFWIFFARHVDAPTALGYAGKAWLSVVATTRYVADPAQARYTGFDQPGVNAANQLIGGAVALAAAAMTFAMGRWLDRNTTTGRRTVLGAVAVVGVASASWYAGRDFWIESGRGLVVLLALYTAWNVRRTARTHARAASDPDGGHVRLLLSVVALALLARMVLHGRIYHFGYYQAALAAVVAVAAWVGELPAWSARSPAARAWVVALAGALFVPGVVQLSAKSAETYAAITIPMGEGRDRFHTYLRAEPMVRVIREFTALPKHLSLLVLPEGLMINYLARLRSPVAPFFLYSAATEGGAEKRLVEQLSADPPEFVITIPRDLEEYGIARYGERSGAGGDLMAWVAANYHGAPGDPPPVYRTDAILVLQRNPGPVRQAR